YRKATELEPDYAFAYRNWGLVLVNLKNYEEAISKYQQATELKPDYVDAYNDWGNVLYDQKLYEEAIEKYKKAADLDPDYVDAYHNWGLALANLKRYGEAIEKYKTAIKKESDYSYSFHNLADMYFKLGMYEEGWASWDDALQAYKRARGKKTLLSSGADFYQYYGDVLRSISEELEEAESIYEEGLKIEPNHIGILSGLVDLYLEQAEMDPKQRSAYYCKARDNYRRAVRLLTELLNRKEDPETRLRLGQLYLKMEDYGIAENTVLPALEKEQESAELNTLLGVLYTRLEDFKKAERYFKEALKYDPDDLNVWSNLAEVFLKLNLKDKAEEEYKKILRIAPTHIESHIGLGEVYLAMEGDDEEMYDRAIHCFNEALKIADSTSRSKNLKKKERAAVLYSRAYARVMYHEKAPVTIKDENYLREAMKDFAQCYSLDQDNHKANRAREKLSKRLNRFSSRWFADQVAPWVIAGLSLVSFTFTQFRFFFFDTKTSVPINDAGVYALLTFGSLIFMVAGFYLPQLLKLKVGGIEIEKTPVEQVSTSMSLGITSR
ncbi:MAG: tetratricopeptide repeat protein, partial [Smithellaceae bacterium]